MDILVLFSEAYAIMETKFAFNDLKVTSDLYSHPLLEGELHYLLGKVNKRISTC